MKYPIYGLAYGVRIITKILVEHGDQTLGSCLFIK